MAEEVRLELATMPGWAGSTADVDRPHFHFRSLHKCLQKLFPKEKT